MYRTYKEPYGYKKQNENTVPPANIKPTNSEIKTESVITKPANKDFLGDILKNFKFDDILLIFLIFMLLQEKNDDYILLLVLGYVFLSEYDIF